MTAFPSTISAASENTCPMFCHRKTGEEDGKRFTERQHIRANLVAEVRLANDGAGNESAQRQGNAE
jgi:hypothetical protein